MSAKIKVYLGALVIFICGAVSGGFGSALASYGAPIFGCHRGHEGRSPEKIADRLAEKLSLTPDQKAKVQKVFESSMPEMKKMKEEHLEAKKAFRKKVGDEIRGLLNADQQKKFDEFRAKMQERMEKKHEGRGKWGEGSSGDDK